VLETCCDTGAYAFTVAGWTCAHATRPISIGQASQKGFPRPTAGTDQRWRSGRRTGARAQDASAI